MERILEARNLIKSYPQGESVVVALNGLSLSVRQGELVMITGESGSGKSTLLKLCGALDTPDSGDLLLFGENTQCLSERKIGELRRTKIGFIFQNFHLIAVLTALENVEYAFKLRRIPDAKKQAKELLVRVGLEDKINAVANTLSGGQMQRVAIARALAGSPNLILADEPTANLDNQNKKLIMQIMTELCREKKITIMVVSHDPSLTHWVDRCIKLNDGREVIG